MYCSTSWGSQPYTGGSYTSIGTGGSQADIETIAEPLYADTRRRKKVRVIRILVDASVLQWGQIKTLKICLFLCNLPPPKKKITKTDASFVSFFFPPTAVQNVRLH